LKYCTYFFRKTTVKLQIYYIFNYVKCCTFASCCLRVSDIYDHMKTFNCMAYLFFEISARDDGRRSKAN